MTEYLAVFGASLVLVNLIDEAFFRSKRERDRWEDFETNIMARIDHNMQNTHMTVYVEEKLQNHYKAFPLKDKEIEEV